MCSLSLSVSLYIYLLCISVLVPARTVETSRGLVEYGARNKKPRGTTIRKTALMPREKERDFPLLAHLDRTVRKRDDQRGLRRRWTSSFLELLYASIPVDGNAKKKKKKKRRRRREKPRWALRWNKEISRDDDRPTDAFEEHSCNFSWLVSLIYFFIRILFITGGGSFTDCMRPEAHQGIYYRV